MLRANYSCYMANTDFVCVIVIVIVHVTSAVWFRYARHFHVSMEKQEKLNCWLFFFSFGKYASSSKRIFLYPPIITCSMHSDERVFSLFFVRKMEKPDNKRTNNLILILIPNDNDLKALNNSFHLNWFFAMIHIR